MIGTGSIGGKANGFFLARRVFSLEQTTRDYPILSSILKFPETTCIGTHVYRDFIKDNALEDHLTRCEAMASNAEEEFLEAALLGKFRPEVVKQLTLFLDGTRYPLAVRSSSLLEDRTNTSFAGKYQTLFISNLGNDGERLSQLLQAIKEVYASIGSRNAIAYRRKHRILRMKEEMGIMLQQAVGRTYNGYFLPLAAGVAFSNNAYCWSPEIKKENGLVRLVFGLGTRAVGRGYARLFSPGHPTSRPEGFAASDIVRFSQATMDALHLETNRLESIHFSKLVKDGFTTYPDADKLFSLRDGQNIYVPTTKMWDANHKPVLTFDGVLQKPWGGVDFPQMMLKLLRIMEAHFKVSVDVEFALLLNEDSTGKEDKILNLYLLQCRPLTQREELNPGPIPDVSRENIITTANRNIRTGIVEKVEYIVYVDPDHYFNCPEGDRYRVARLVGKINNQLEGRRFILMGPGRWGSVKVDLGVAVRYEEIANTLMLVEIARGGYSPEMSFGTHFFQDLIEDQIQYLPIAPDDPGIIFNERLFSTKNHFDEFITDGEREKFREMIRVIHIPSLFEGRLAYAIMNGEEEKAIIFVK